MRAPLVVLLVFAGVAAGVVGVLVVQHQQTQRASEQEARDQLRCFEVGIGTSKHHIIRNYTASSVDDARLQAREYALLLKSRDSENNETGDLEAIEAIASRAGACTLLEINGIIRVTK